MIQRDSSETSAFERGERGVSGSWQIRTTMAESDPTDFAPLYMFRGRADRFPR